MKRQQTLSGFQNLFSNMVIGNVSHSSDVRGKVAELDKDLNENQQFFLTQVEENQRPHFEKRFAVYRNNVHHSLIQALADTFPIVQQLVGEEFFQLMAKEYLHFSPPASAVLLEFGYGFSSFIKSFEAAQSLGYLSDLANLEYQWQKAYHAEDVASVDAEYFAGMPVESLYEQGLACHPSLQLVSSNFSVGSIWQVHQDLLETQKQQDAELHIDIPEWLIVVRPEYDVQVCFVDEPGYQFVDRLNQGVTLGSAIAELSESFPEWDIVQALAFAIQNGFFVKSANP